MNYSLTPWKPAGLISPVGGGVFHRGLGFRKAAWSWAELMLAVVGGAHAGVLRSPNRNAAPPESLRVGVDVSAPGRRSLSPFASDSSGSAQLLIKSWDFLQNH